METNIIFPKPPKTIKQEKNKASFEIVNCYPGFGMTLGTALRRVLISSLPGAAITSVKIKGVKHEFSTISNVLEDVIQIILNLKQIRFKLHSPGPTSLTLKAKGEKEVKASDIKLNSDIEIMNKNAHIATLTDKKASLEMEINVDSGLGYVSVEQRKKEKLPVGTIAIDAIFSPIRKVNYEIENMRVGDRTDFNRLKINIETDGTITPKEALKKASQILVEHFSILAESTTKSKQKKEKSKKKTAAKKSQKKTKPKTKKTKPKKRSKSKKKSKSKSAKKTKKSKK